MSRTSTVLAVLSSLHSSEDMVVQSQKWKKWRKWGVPVLLTLGVSVGLGVYGFKNGPSREDLSKVAERFTFTTVFVALFFDLFQNFMMMVRLRLLAKAAGFPKSNSAILGAIGLGQFVNLVLPARVGDLLKIGFLGTIQNGPGATTAVGVLLADRLIDTFSFVLLVFLTGAAFSPEVTQAVSGWGWGPVLTGVLVLVILFWLFRGRFRVLQTKWRDFKTGLKGVLNPKVFLWSSVAGSVVWLSEGASLLVLIRTIPLEASWAQVFFIFVVLNLSIAIPVSIGNLGVFEAALVGAMRLIGFPLAEAVALAVLHHFLQFLATVLWALVAVPFVFRMRSRNR